MLSDQSVDTHCSGVQSRTPHGLCMCAGLQQTPQEIWTGLETILPALRPLLISCNAVAISGMPNADKTSISLASSRTRSSCSCHRLVHQDGNACVHNHVCRLLWLGLAIDLSCQAQAMNPCNGHKHSTTSILLFANCAKFLYTGIASTLDVCQCASPFVVTLP